MDRYRGLRARLERGETVLLDGGIGSELVRRGVRWRNHGMSTDAPAVQALHAEYLQAGADLIRTNTFQLNRRTYLNVFRDPSHMRRIGAPGLEDRAPELIGRAVALARAARDHSPRNDACVAGVMSPLQHCFRPDLSPPPEQARPEHGEIASLLAEAGVDLLLLESMNTIAEARAAASAATAAGLPVWTSFTLGPDGSVLSGEPLADAVRAMLELGAEAVLVNCLPPDDVSRALSVLAGQPRLFFGAYPHVGRFDPPSWKFEFFPQFTQTEAWPPERYVSLARGWLEQGARIVGGCCGTGPAHTRALRAGIGARP